MCRLEGLCYSYRRSKNEYRNRSYTTRWSKEIFVTIMCTCVFCAQLKRTTTKNKMQILIWIYLSAKAKKEGFPVGLFVKRRVRKPNYHITCKYRSSIYRIFVVDFNDVIFDWDYFVNMLILQSVTFCLTN